jgi:hypothetical protein
MLDNYQRMSSRTSVFALGDTQNAKLFDLGVREYRKVENCSSKMITLSHNYYVPALQSLQSF